MHGGGGNQPKYLVLNQKAPHHWVRGSLFFYTTIWSQNLGTDYLVTQHLSQKNPDLSYNAANLKNFHNVSVNIQVVGAWLLTADKSWKIAVRNTVTEDNG
jgi:hypothetical protein